MDAEQISQLMSIVPVVKGLQGLQESMSGVPAALQQLSSQLGDIKMVQDRFSTDMKDAMSRIQALEAQSSSSSVAGSMAGSIGPGASSQSPFQGLTASDWPSPGSQEPPSSKRKMGPPPSGALKQTVTFQAGRPRSAPPGGAVGEEEETNPS